MARLICNGCQQTITGKYIQALRAAWHPDCFRCAHCGEPIAETGFMAKNGKPYHPACYRERFSLRCHACKQPIEGKYLRVLGKIWHPEHFTCAHCGKILEDKYFSRHGKPYCEKDFLLLFREKCALCGAPLGERYLEDLSGNHYCAAHENDPRCSNCNRFIGTQAAGQGITYADGRLTCSDCHAHAILEVSDAYSLIKDVKKVLRGYDFHFQEKPPLKLHLLGTAELQAISRRRRNHEPSGVTQTHIENVFGVETHREVTGVFMLYGLSPEHLGSVLAHELGHVWLFTNRYPDLPNVLEEGLCELLAAYWLEQQAGDLARMRLRMLEKNPSRIYGTGYRKVRKAVERNSLPYVLDYLKRYARLPD